MTKLYPGERECDHCGAILDAEAKDCEVRPEEPYQRVLCTWTTSKGKLRKSAYPAPCLARVTN